MEASPEVARSRSKRGRRTSGSQQERVSRLSCLSGNLLPRSESTTAAKSCDRTLPNQFEMDEWHDAGHDITNSEVVGGQNHGCWGPQSLGFKGSNRWETFVVRGLPKERGDSPPRFPVRAGLLSQSFLVYTCGTISVPQLWVTPRF